MTISERIFYLLDKKKKSQKELADAINVSLSTVNAWKIRGSLPSADKIHSIAEFLGVTADYLLTGFDRELPPDERLTAAYDHKGNLINLSEEQEAYLKGLINQALNERVEALRKEALKEYQEKKD